MANEFQTADARAPGRVSDVGARYAQALFDLAKEADQVSAVESDLKALKAMRRDSDDLRRLIASPSFGAEDKGKALAGVAQAAGFSQITRKFLGLLAHNRRVAALPDVITAFFKLTAGWRGTVSAEVVSAVPLTDMQLQSITSALRQSLGRLPEVEARVDPSILGGVRVRVGSRLYDASLKSRLDHLKFALKRA